MKVFLTIAALAAATPALAEAPILPGYWESTNHVSFIIEQDTTSRKCITADLAESYLTGPSNNHYTCVYDHSEVGGGKVALGGQCIDSGVKVRVNANGTYTKTSFEVEAQLSTKFAGLPLTGTATTKAHRLSEICPVAEKK